MTRLRRALLAALVASSLTAARLDAFVPPNSPVTEKSYRHPNLHIPIQNLPLAQLPAESAANVGADIESLGLGTDSAFFDPRAGRLASLILSVPLVPGTGVGNQLKWLDLGGRPADEGAMKDFVWLAVLDYLRQNQSVLRVDLSELSAPRVSILEGGSLIQVYSQRVINGFPVRDSSVTAVINHGNLVLLGLQNWGDAASLAATPQIGFAQARGVVAQHVQGLVIEGFGRGDGRLEYVPMVAGDGYEYRLVWVLRVDMREDDGTWEGLVDAVSGELVAFEDKNQYAARKAIGGVYPVSNDQRPPDGLEQTGWPMPFANVTTPSGTIVTNAAGTIGCATGTVSTALVGRYARIADTCGAINETSAAGDLDLGFGPTPAATDCTVPAGHSAGDTKSARSGFYELTRINEQARGYLPTNNWLTGPALLANMNQPQTCNANWNGTSVQFFRSAVAQGCRNTGEIAAIFDHEWGHGMDNNGTNPTISGPGEGIADVHAFIRLNTDCVGRGFFINNTCGGYGDACIGTAATGCTGVRTVDFAQRRCNRPHTITYITQGFTSAQCGGTGTAPACPGSGGPCGRAVHCEGAVVGESAFDLARRDLPAAGFDANTAHELTTRLFYLGSQAVTNWYTCNAGGGCGATGGYLQVLAADDDNGNLNDGTPHMVQIRAAFERHETHCATPAAVNSGCAGGPAQTPPVLTGVIQDQGVNLSWNAIAGATRYYVYRTEGVNGDTFGKVKIAEVTGTSFLDTNLQNGRTYYFTVWPVGASGSCFGRLSNSLTVVPTPGANVAVDANFTYTRTGGDGDEFLDNCEAATVNFTVSNTGTGTLTNVRLTAVEFLDHPTSILQTPLPAVISPSLADCAIGNGSFTFTLQGATFNQSTRVRVTVTADQLGGQTRQQTFTINNLESDFQTLATRTYDFDTDLSGWTVQTGTFTRQPVGANGTPFHVSSSENLEFQCDVIRTPLVRLSATSTLSLQNNYDIEPTDPTGGPYDRANVGVVDLALGTRTVVSPSSGTLYSVPANPTPNFTACELGGQAGWNGTSPGYPAFAASNWTSAALNPGGVFTGRAAQLEIRYGTDPLLHPEGFDFDQVVITNFDQQVPDTLTNTCVAQAAAPLALAVDAAGNQVMEPSETAVMAPTWRNTGTQAITLTGALSSFTGPAATYTINDGSASYGTIPIGGSQSCGANCYSLTASAATRPITHWDSTVVETVNPSATAKTWTLHIGASFVDVTTASPFYRFIETILHRNVTGGCTLTAYCPVASTTREQMAVFVLVSKDQTAPPPPVCVAGSEMFTDVPASSPFCRWIEELARRGVVTGCGGGAYCPTAPATREAMAVFVLRTLDPTLNPPACGTPMFADVPASSPFCRWIEELARRGVVTGCGGGNYCPTADVSREQMSVFLAVTFGLTIYGL
jgi:hypothetical protein